MRVSRDTKGHLSVTIAAGQEILKAASCERKNEVEFGKNQASAKTGGKTLRRTCLSSYSQESYVV